jgi:hypothetical protein
MSRAINALVAQELAKDSVTMCHLLEIHLDTSSYLTDAGQDMVFGGHTFVSSSHFLNVQTVRESSELRVGTTKLVLSGVEQLFISAFINGSYVARQVRVLRAFLNDQNAIIGEPVLIYDGRIDTYNIKDSKNTSTIEVDLASHWADFEKKSGRVTNSNSQSLHFAGDKGFDFAANIVKDIKWGRA